MWQHFTNSDEGGTEMVKPIGNNLAIEKLKIQVNKKKVVLMLVFLFLVLIIFCGKTAIIYSHNSTEKGMYIFLT